VESCLREIEEENGLRVVFASEHSSHVFGYATSNSDHDILGLFVHNRATYFGMVPVTKTIRKQFVVPVGECALDTEVWMDGCLR
jgi:predicted nucleotidyltransferase